MQQRRPCARTSLAQPKPMTLMPGRRRVISPSPRPRQGTEMTTKHLFSTMTWPEVNEAVKQRRVVLIPFGANEQDRQHLPVDVDKLSFTSHLDPAPESA